jgi:TetR/AcrR family transcriptional regulator
MKKPPAAPATPLDTDTEQRILDAAHKVFVQRGTAGARMQEIADEAGVNKALLHYYFRSKDGLADAVFKRVARGVFGRLAEVASSDATLEDKVRRIIAVYLEQLNRAPFVPGYVIGELSQHPERAQQLVDTLRQFTNGPLPPVFLEGLRAQIGEAVRGGRIRPMSAEQFIANLVSLSVFPFAAKPLLCAVLGMDAAGFARFIEDRKTALPEFFLAALQP